MSSLQMVLVTNLRVELHPDFSAQLIAKWKVGMSSLNRPEELAWRAKIFCDDGQQIHEAIESAKQQINQDVVRVVCAQFWTEFRIANAMRSKAGRNSQPASINPIPSI